MWVCVCNGIHEDDEKIAIQKGAKTALEVLESCGGEVCCGICVPHIQRQIDKVLIKK
jgi:bacterioferritin-associated ferredoxin